MDFYESTWWSFIAQRRFCTGLRHGFFLEQFWRTALRFRGSPRAARVSSVTSRTTEFRVRRVLQEVAVSSAVFVGAPNLS
ncbi:MAG: hypothetical protein JWM55_1030 [Acidimicrobiaceae bacterium]|nr:hypothetical protein [Acidimicrobiaceae bacterium]